MEIVDTLPVDIIIEIFLLLPAKTLLRFKCMRKLWYHLISSDDFAKRRLERSLATQSDLHFVYQDPVLKLADLDTFDNAIELNYPFKGTNSVGGACVKGYCNGLLCLWNYDYYHLIVAFFNPTTRTYKLLPYLPRPSHVAHLLPCYIYGFGYDSVVDDYKLVRILECYDKDTDTYPYGEVMVYSMKADSWSRVRDGVPHRFDCRRIDGVLVNECLHWVIDTPLYEPLCPIVSFNLSTHSFAEVHVPQIDEQEYIYMHVGVLDGCLCILVNYLEESEIWIMKEYGVVESWTKLVRAQKASDGDSVQRTVCFSSSGKDLFVMLCLDRLSSIDLENKVVKPVQVFANPLRLWSANVCVENLLMLSDSCYALESESQEVNNKRQRRRRRGRKSSNKRGQH